MLDRRKGAGQFCPFYNADMDERQADRIEIKKLM